MSKSKDMLECMATILRDNGYEVALKESDNETKKPYVSNKFNKISALDLNALSYDTCMFLNGNVVSDFKLHDYVAGSCDVTIGYIERIYEDDDEDDDEDECNEDECNEDNYCVEDFVIKTNRNNPVGCTIVEKLSDYAYVIKLSDVFKLMASNEDFND